MRRHKPGWTGELATALIGLICLIAGGAAVFASLVFGAPIWLIVIAGIAAFFIAGVACAYFAPESADRAFHQIFEGLRF